MEFEFKTTKGMANEDAPEGKVLVKYLEPSFGGYYIEYAVGYYDNPNSYGHPSEGEGWKLWNNSNPINVLEYALLPEIFETYPLTQREFLAKHGSFFPNLGNIPE